MPVGKGSDVGVDPGSAAPVAFSLPSRGLDSSDTVLSGLSISAYSEVLEGAETRTYDLSDSTDFSLDILVERMLQVSILKQLAGRRLDHVHKNS